MARLPIISILCSALAASAFASGPKAIPVEPIKDFEIVNQGTNIRHTFEIRNEGSAPLEITDVRPACGCTVVEFDKTILAGGTGRIVTTLKTDEFNGPISKSIAVYTNDPENPRLQLVMRAKIKTFLAAIPGYARYNYVQGEATRAIPQTIWANDNSDFDIVDVKAPNRYLMVSKREAREDEMQEGFTGKHWVVDINIKPNAPVGALRGHVTVVTTHSEQEKVLLPISGFVRPRQHITPQKLDFGQLQSASLPVRRILDLTSFIEAEIAATKIESEIPGLSAEIVDNVRDSTDKGHRFKLHVTLDEQAPMGALEGNLKIHITDPLNPIVELPVNGIVLDQVD